MLYKNKLILLISAFIFSTHILAVTKMEKSSALKKYYQVHRKFRDQICTSNVLKQYWELTRKQKKSGFYLPIIDDEKINVFVVQKNLALVRKKIQWLKGVERKLNKEKDFNTYREYLNGLKSDMEKLVILKASFYEEQNRNSKKKVAKKSRRVLKKFNEDMLSFFKKTYFLQSFSYPINHKLMRDSYDQLKRRNDLAGINFAQDLFFKRKLYEDGAPHPYWRGSDLSIRSLINGITFRLRDLNNRSFIDESLRYDLVWLFKAVDRYLTYHQSIILKKIKSWRNKTEKQLAFYNNLLSGKIEHGGKEFKVSDYLSDRKDSGLALEHYIYTQQAKTYKFWSKQDPELRKLFVIDTIILNEVGGTPDFKDLEKSEVLKVVYNRSNIKFYSSIASNENLYPYLEKEAISPDKYKWLNVLFKKGEFSFTYHYIPGTYRLFCPDMSRRAKNIRETAVSLGVELLNSPPSKLDVLPVRYFSRVSMLGRIDMSDLWEEFQALPEEPGVRISREEAVGNSLDETQFLYMFQGPKKTYFKVFQGEKGPYVTDKEEKNYYSYRNPHYFKYFVEK